MSAPEFMPVLKAGCHDAPEEGACVMEYVSYITGEEFTDTPVCTPLLLVHLAQFANDMQPDDDVRSARMLPLIPRLAGKGRDIAFDRHLAQFLYQKGLDSTDPLPEAAWFAANVYTRGGQSHSMARAARNAQGLVSHIFDPASHPERLVDLLVECLDEYDRWLERDTPTFTDEQTAGVKRLAEMIRG